MTVNIGKQGVRPTIGIPGSGMSYTIYPKKGSEKNTGEKVANIEGVDSQEGSSLGYVMDKPKEVATTLLLELGCGVLTSINEEVIPSVREGVTLFAYLIGVALLFPVFLVAIGALFMLLH
jgi:hypothetical protein